MKNKEIRALILLAVVAEIVALILTWFFYGQISGWQAFARFAISLFLVGMLIHFLIAPAKKGFRRDILGNKIALKVFNVIVFIIFFLGISLLVLIIRWVFFLLLFSFDLGKDNIISFYIIASFLINGLVFFSLYAYRNNPFDNPPSEFDQEKIAENIADPDKEAILKILENSINSGKWVTAVNVDDLEKLTERGIVSRSIHINQMDIPIGKKTQDSILIISSYRIYSVNSNFIKLLKKYS